MFLGKSLFCLATDSAIKPRTLARTGGFHVRSLLSGGVIINRVAGRGLLFVRFWRGRHRTTAATEIINHLVIGMTSAQPSACPGSPPTPASLPCGHQTTITTVETVFGGGGVCPSELQQELSFSSTPKDEFVLWPFFSFRVCPKITCKIQVFSFHPVQQSPAGQISLRLRLAGCVPQTVASVRGYGSSTSSTTISTGGQFCPVFLNPMLNASLVMIILYTRAYRVRPKNCAVVVFGRYAYTHARSVQHGQLLQGFHHRQPVKSRPSRNTSPISDSRTCSR